MHNYCEGEKKQLGSGGVCRLGGSRILASKSETKVYYPTVNRRMHELLRRHYVEKAGTKITKAGVPADLYATRLRGDFAALAGIPDSSGKYASELSPKETRRMIEIASFRQGSPFLLFRHIIEEGQIGIDFVDKDLVPEIVNSVRNGYLNIDALDEEVMCSAFASLVARKVANLAALSGRNKSDKQKEQIKILMRSLEKTLAFTPVANDRTRKDHAAGESAWSTQKSVLTPVSHQWVNELKVFLKLYSAMSV